MCLDATEATKIALKLILEYMYRTKEFEIRGKNVASSKNAKRICNRRIVNSVLAMEYYEFVLPILQDMKNDILSELEKCEKPYRFHFYYYRKDKRHFDYANVVQILADAFQKAGILEDDDMNNFIPYFDGYEVNGEKPGVKFYIEKLTD